MPEHTCTKRRYTSIGDAITALKAIRRNGTPTGKLPVAPYPCESCRGFWHLTSQKPKGRRRAWWEKFSAE